MSYSDHVNPGAPKKRLLSLDVLRGFDMFWIIGAKALADGLDKLNLPGVATVTHQLSHSDWNGFTFYDLIFPLFIFITGVSLVFSINKRVENGDPRGAILKHVFMRTVILFLLGIAYNGFGSYQSFLSDIRVMGVLQRSALCYFFAALFVLYTRPRTQACTVVGIVALYWLIMRYIPVPGYGAGVWTEQGNLARYLDNLLLPGRLYFGSWDPEGLLTTLPAVATCLLGVLSGHWLRAQDWHRGHFSSAKQRALFLFLAGVGLAVCGLLISPAFPINKKLWTSSFVLLTGGLSAMLLAALYWLVDICSCRRWAFPFVVIGANSLFIYLAARFIPFDKAAHLILRGDLLSLLGRGQSLLDAVAQLLLEGLLLLWLYNRKRFIRI